MFSEKKTAVRSANFTSPLVPGCFQIQLQKKGQLKFNRQLTIVMSPTSVHVRHIAVSATKMKIYRDKSL